MISLALLISYLAVGLALVDEARAGRVPCWWCRVPTLRVVDSRPSCGRACDAEINDHYA